MKKLTVMLVCISILLSACITYVSAEEAYGGSVYEVHSWEDFKAAFDQWPTYSNQSFQVKLMADLHYDARDTSRTQTSMVEVHIKGSHYTFDFNGHTLSATDAVSDTDLDTSLSDFITVYMHAFRNDKGSTLRLTDSVGGGGVRMYSHRAHDSQLAALRVAGVTDYEDCGYYQYTGNRCSTLIIDGGNYTLTAKTEKFGSGTRLRENYYRGCVIADYVNTEINDGTFTAKSEGVVTQYDMCARELSAFATCCSGTLNPRRREKGDPVINGGKFISDGYALHHFDNTSTPDEISYMVLPIIKGGAFFGGISYIGKAYTYSDGNEEYESMEATEILRGEAYYMDDGELEEVTDLTLKDLHKSEAVYVVSDSTFDLEVTPDYYYDYTPVSPSGEDTYRIKYTVPESMKGVLTVKPFISHCSVDKATQETGKETRVYSTYCTVKYSDYSGGVMIRAGLEVLFDNVAIEIVRSSRVEINRDEIGHAEISLQPADCTVDLGETAATTVIANCARSYQWEIGFGGGWIPITDDFAASFAASGIIISGYKDFVLAVTNESGKSLSMDVRCVITSTAYSTTTTDAATLTLGNMPIIDRFYGGSFKEGGDAVFYLWGYYFDEVKWTVSSRIGVFKQYTLDDFKAKTGVDYDISLLEFRDNLYRVTVTFKNVPISLADKYKLGYSVSNSLGKVAWNEANAIPFTLETVKPTVTAFVKSVSGYEGDELSISFSAHNMTEAEWRFETTDEEGVAKVVSLEQMQAAFPDSDFDIKTEGDTSTLTVTNAKEGLNEYALYGYAVGENAVINAGCASFRIKVKGDVILLGDVTGDGKVNSLDAAFVLRYDASLIGEDRLKLDAADVTGDGKINALDAAFILRYDAGLLPSFSKGAD
ncbi:MAG: dockerin type I repeat-containing protein [Clostridia bacterium]|nr:dockerin type I repeat-containing protein [Clostridia bacterium]